MRATLLDKSVKILLLTFLSFALLYYGKPFLVPFLIASLLAMLIMPLSMKLEKKMNRVLAVVISILVLLLILGVIISLLVWQVSDIADKAPKIQQNVTEKLEQLREFASNTLGMSEQQQQRILPLQTQISGSRLSSILTGAITSLGSFLAHFIIVMVYIFLFLYFRDHFEKFMMKLVPKQSQETAQETMHDVRMVSQKYITGLAMMIACLWIMYGIGFSIIGVENAIFFAILCGLLEIVPFVGNLVGVSFTVLMSLAQGGNVTMLIGIAITYGVVQFVQTYLLEPMVVGREISINPVFTILGLVGGQILWGIPGMILILPLLAILKIVCDHIEPLKPYGFLIGDDKNEGKNISSKIKKFVKEKL